MLQTGQHSWCSLLTDLELCFPRHYICSSEHSGYGKKPYGKTIWKLVTDSFLVAKKQPSISAMGSVHNKPSLDMSVVVSITLSSYCLLYKKCKDILSTNWPWAVITLGAWNGGSLSFKSRKLSLMKEQHFLTHHWGKSHLKTVDAGKAEVSQFYLSTAGHQNVLWF